MQSEVLVRAVVKSFLNIIVPCLAKFKLTDDRFRSEIPSKIKNNQWNSEFSAQ